MSNQPLNLDAEVSKDQTIFVYETAERDYPQHGSIMLKLHHSNFQSSLWQVSKRTAESLRDQLNDLVAVAHPVVNSVEELDDLPAGVIAIGADDDPMQLHTDGEGSYCWRRFWDEARYTHTDVALPARVLYRPVVEP